MTLFLNADERTQATVVAAGVALHGLLASGALTRRPAKHDELVSEAFAIATEFWKQAEALPTC